MPILKEAKWALYFHFGRLLLHYSELHLDYFNIFWKKTQQSKIFQKTPKLNESWRNNTFLFV